MLNLLWLLLGCYALGMLSPLCLRRPRAQALAAHLFAAAATGMGVGLGIWGLLSVEALAAAAVSSLPLLTFAIRLDPLASFFLLTISLVALAVSIYAIGYVPPLPGPCLR